MNFYTANLDILHHRFPQISRRMQTAELDPNIRFSVSKSGHQIIYERFGNREYPLHSTMDPSREAERLVKSSGDAGFIAVYGLGAAWHIQGLLNNKKKDILIILDGSHRLRTFLDAMDYREILQNPRVSLLLDPGPQVLIEYLLNNYLPGIHGGFSFIPLPALAARKRDRISLLQKAADLALRQIRNDFSVQAHFGLLWSRNFIANLASLSKFPDASRYDILTRFSEKKALLIGAGPSLRDDSKLIRYKSSDSIVIAVDTALPFLLELNLTPDLVVSIDSQYYTLLHAIQPGSLEIPWAVTLTAPPALVQKLKQPVLFAGGTPLERAIAPLAGLPDMDTHGGNVLQAAISLTAWAGIDDLTIFGADYSQPGGIPYAPGTYVDRWFRIREQRTAPFLGQSLAFTFAGRFEQECSEYDPLYPCRRLDRYRENLLEYLNGYSGKLEIHGASSFLLPQQPQPGPSKTAGHRLIPPEKMPKPAELLGKILGTIKHGSAGALPILYPLIANLRHRHDLEIEPSDKLIEEAQTLFLSLADAYTGE